MLALSTHDPSTRVSRAAEWLNQNGAGCTTEQLQAIANNRAAWMGSADTPQIMGLVDGLLEARAQGKGTTMERLYSSSPPAPGAAAEVLTTPPPRPPIEDLRPGPAVLSGVMPPDTPPPRGSGDIPGNPAGRADRPQGRTAR